MSVATPKKDTAGSIIAALMILLGAFAWWDTTSMADADSFVFPRTVIIAMITFSLMLIFFNFIRPGVPSESDDANRSSPRRISLVLAMLGSALVMPYLGFFISGLMVFGALMAIAMYDPWTRSNLIAYPISGVAIVVGFYTLFSEVLLVPLPTGMIFE